MKLHLLANKKVAVWGYGVEGKATLAYLKKHLPALSVTVLCPENEADGDALFFEHKPVTEAVLNEFDVVIKSPGISPYQSGVKNSRATFISASSLWFSNEYERFEQRPKVVAITGTKGKSTSSYLLHEALKASGLESVIAGNYGTPLIACGADYDVIVLETSSYQAQDGAIIADLAVMLNLYSEHLDWHISEDQYRQDKWRLLQQAKHSVLNEKDANSKKMMENYPLSSVSWFNHFSGFYVIDDVLMFQDKALLSVAAWSFQGRHNLENLAAVLSVILWLGLDLKPVLNRLKKCPPLPHRLQSLGCVNGVYVINDSISSTPHATWAALQTCPVERTVLLVGGYERGVDWHWFAQQISAQPPKLIICSGANGQRILQTLLQHNDTIDCKYVSTLSKAVEQALMLTEKGDYLLLSPGAPSFDAFDNYQHRGDQFSQWVKQN